MLKVKFEDLRFFIYYQAILVFIENGQNAVQRSLYLENSYENTKGTAITTITATITSTKAATTSTTTIKTKWQ